MMRLKVILGNMASSRSAKVIWNLTSKSQKQTNNFIDGEVRMVSINLFFRLFYILYMVFCNPGWPWTAHLSASISQCCDYWHVPPSLVYDVLRTKFRAFFILYKHATQWTMPRFWKQSVFKENVFSEGLETLNNIFNFIGKPIKCLSG